MAWTVLQGSRMLVTQYLQARFCPCDSMLMRDPCLPPSNLSPPECTYRTYLVSIAQIWTIEELPVRQKVA
jgi:hypothetical protein